MLQRTGKVNKRIKLSSPEQKIKGVTQDRWPTRNSIKKKKTRGEGGEKT